MGLISPKCTSCGASLPPREEGGLVTCDYCGCRFQPKTPPPEPKPKPQRPKPQAPPKDSPRGPTEVIIQAPPVLVVKPAARGGCGVVLAALMVVIMTGAVAVFLLVGKDGVIAFGERIVNEVAKAGGQRTLWDSVGGSPLPVTIAGEPAVIGRVRTMPDDNLVVGAFRPTSGEPLWTVEDLGTYTEGYQHTRYAVAAGRLLVSDSRGRVRVVALRDGRVERVVTLSDKVQHLCVIDGGKAAWLDVIDERPLRLDPETGATEPMARPAQCPQWAVWRRNEDRVAAAAKAPPIPGFTAKRVLRVGSTAVAAGVKSPGTAVPQAVGFDPASGAVAWRVTVPSVDPNSVQGDAFEADDLNVGRYVAAYGVGTKGYRVAAFDAKTGNRVWDVELRRLFAVDRVDELVVSKRYVYVVRTSSLDVLELATGKRISTIGDDTYEDEVN